MRIHCILALAATLSLAPVASVRADVQIVMRDGRVTLNAAGATIREILAAWAKVGQTRIVNAERVSGGPITLHLQDIPEEQALEIILRSVSGYLAAPRADAIANASRYDRIFVMPTSTPPRTAPAPQPPAFPQPQFNPTIQQPSPFTGDDDDPMPNPNMPPGQRGPLFTFPQPGVPPQPVGVVPPGMPPPPVRQGSPPVRGGPYGVAVPGMIVEPPPPAQPGIPPPQP
jgi:hypothetical protein